MSPVEQVMGVPELVAKLQQLDEVVQASNLAMAVQAGGQVILNAAKNNIRDEGLIKTGNLRRGLHMEVVEVGTQQATIEVGTDTEYAAIHEFGGTITPKKGKYLAIPVGSYTDSPSNHPGLQTRMTANGNMVMYDDGGIQYVLMTSVTIPAQPYMRPALDDNEDRAKNEIGKALVQLIQEAIA